MTLASTVIAQREFALADLHWFAAASGDWNPIHVDPVQARRLLAGEVVVHGMFTLLWALDAYCAAGGTCVAAIAASFPKPVLVGKRITLSREPGEPGTVRLAIRSEGVEVATVLLQEGGSRIGTQPDASRPLRLEPEINAFPDLKDRAGKLRVSALPQDLEQAFSHASRVLGAMPVASLLALSRLVGMQCPGLHSLFASIDLRLDPGQMQSELAWRVSRHTVPQAPLRVSLEGGGLSGRLDAFVRPAPVAQPGMAEVASTVKPFSFAGQVALVLGGSRGLGELTAKIIAAGGGHAIVTYLHGVADAERVAAEIVSAGGRASVLQMDVEQPQGAVDCLMRQGVMPTHLYYFAAPRIGSRKGGGFDGVLWQSFSKVFVEAFARVVQAVKQTGRELRVFYPSTVFIDEQPAEHAEYVAAKTAGEAVCRHMTRHIPGLHVLARRLPRVPTDQTAGLIRLATAEPLPLMLGVVHDMQLIAQSSTQEPQP